jgi:hypothetical protein
LTYNEHLKIIQDIVKEVEQQQQKSWIP